jgi:hypothetical protein
MADQNEELLNGIKILPKVKEMVLEVLAWKM